jgi:RNA polymerase sigma factor (sigma-70 family)
VSANSPLVLVVDDDESVRRSLRRLLCSSGYEVRSFATPREFLDGDHGRPDQPRCVVADVMMPGLSGIELQEELAERGIPLPVVFVTGHGDIPMGVRAMREGAVDFLTKPFDERDLLSAVDRAMLQCIEEAGRREDSRRARDALSDLTPREHEVLRYVIAGLLNKQIAARMDISEKTVKVHRGRVMQKAGVESVAQLVRLAGRAGISPAG